MNFYQDELTAQYNRQRVQEELEQIRLERLSVNSTVHKSSRSERIMLNLANWMISTGKQLRKRYEIPSVNCAQKTTNSFAR